MKNNYEFPVAQGESAIALHFLQIYLIADLIDNGWVFIPISTFHL
jgi:hypothetical protein